MKVLVDLDGVLGDLHTTWYKAHNHTCMICKKPLRKEDVLTWDTHKYTACGKDIYSYLDLQGIYRNAPIVEGAVYGTLALQEMGLDLHVVTHSYSVNAIVGKHAWLAEHFPHIPFDHIIHAKNKSMIEGDFIIDDYIENLRGNRDGVRILFNLTHNQEENFTEEQRIFSKRVIRAMSWNDIVSRFKVWN